MTTHDQDDSQSKNRYPLRHVFTPESGEPHPIFTDACPAIYETVTPDICGERVNISVCFSELTGQAQMTGDDKYMHAKFKRVVTYNGEPWLVLTLEDELPGWTHTEVARPLNSEESTWLQAIAMRCQSVTYIMRRVRELREMANDHLYQYCENLARALPKSMCTYAASWGWMPIRGSWKLPNAIESIYLSNHGHEPWSCVVNDDNLIDGGFDTLAQAEDAFLELAEAWKPFGIRVSIQDLEDRLEVEMRAEKA